MTLCHIKHNKYHHKQKNIHQVGATKKHFQNPLILVSEKKKKTIVGGLV